MQNKVSFSGKWPILISVSVGSFMGGMSSSMINLSFPRLANVFHTDASIVLWVTVAYMLVSTGLMPILGKIGDIFGRKKVYLLGIAVFTLGLILCAISQSVVQLIIFRIIQAVGGAMVTALSFAIVTASFGDEERGKALGILTSVGLAGPLVGPVISGLVLDALDWRSLFYLVIPLSLAALIMSWICLKEQKALDTGPKIDYLGAATLFGSLSCLLLFLNMGGRVGFTSPAVIVLIIAAVLLFVVFIIRESRITYPIVDLKLFNNGVFTLGNVTQLLQSIGLAGFVFMTPFFLIDGLGFSSIKAGLTYIFAPLLTALLAPVSGWLSDKISSRLLCTVGMAIITGGLFLLSRSRTDATFISLLPAFVTYGVGMAMFRAPNANLIMGSVTRNKLGLASALMSTLSQIGMSAGMAIFGLILTTREAANLARLASQNLEPTLAQRLSVVSGYRDAILIAAIISGVGIFTAAISYAKQERVKPVTLATNK